MPTMTTIIIIIIIIPFIHMFFVFSFVCASKTGDRCRWTSWNFVIRIFFNRIYILCEINACEEEKAKE